MCRRPCSMTKKPYSSRSDAVGTVNRSMAAISSLWLRKKAIHRFSWSGSAGRRGRYRDTVLSEMMKPSLVSSAWMRGAPQPSCAIVRTTRRISASIRGRPGWRRCEIFAQYRRNRSRCQRATVSAWTMSRRLAHTGHEPRRATQKARSVSSSGGRGRSFFSAVTCCRKATFSNTRSARRRHIARMARTPSETRKTTTLSIAAEFRRLRPGIQAERKSLISWAEQF